MRLLNRVAHMDIFDLCDCIDDNKVDMILADLPYGITDIKEWDNVIPFEPMWEAFKRIIKPRGAIVLTASGKFTYKLVASNMDMFKYDWIWVNKARPTMSMHAKNRPLNVYELILIFSDGVINHESLTDNRMNYYPQMRKGKPYKKVNHKSAFGGVIGSRPSHQDNFVIINDGTRYPLNVIEIDKSNNNSYHPTQKPVALFEYLIRTYTQPGEVVFDPCVGSGTTAIAARTTGRNFVVGDNSAEYVDIARKRLDKPYTMPMFDEQPKQDDKAQQLDMFDSPPLHEDGA
jgi:site-specific DNA-methyltransferase (adenine-specific)